jgi:hypothetical protein
MQIKLEENEYGLNITLEPVSIEDFALILRFGMNALAEKPDVFVSFANEPYCSIYMKKRNQRIQINSINPNLKRK